MCVAHSRHKAHGRRKAHEHRWSKERERGLGGPRQSDDAGRSRGPFGIRKNAGRVNAAKRTGQRDGMHGIAHIAMRIARAANRRHTSPSRARNR